MKRPCSHVIGDRAIARIQDFITQNTQWTVDIPKQDYGEDVHVRIFEGNSKTPFSFYMQIKGKEKVRWNKKDTFPFSAISQKHISMWKKYRYPVIVVLWDLSENLGYWVGIEEETEKIVFEKSKILNSESLEFISGWAKYQTRLLDLYKRNLESFIEILNEKGLGVEFIPETNLVTMNDVDFVEKSSDKLLYIFDNEITCALSKGARETNQTRDEFFNEILKKGINIYKNLSREEFTKSFEKSKWLKMLAEHQRTQE